MVFRWATTPYVDVEDFVEALKQQDENAISFLRESIVKGYFRSRLGKILRCYPDEIDNVVQEVVFNIVSKIETLKDLYCFFGWTKRIVTNKAIRVIRSRQKASEHVLCFDPSVLDAVADHTNPEAILLDKEVDEETTRRVILAVSRLSPSNKLVFLQRHWDDLSYAEIARQNGKTVSAVKSSISRARQEFRDLFRQIVESC